MELQLVSVPLTCCHKVGIVAGYSNSEIVNPMFVHDTLSGLLMDGVEKPHHRLSADLASARKGHNRCRRKT